MPLASRSLSSVIAAVLAGAALAAVSVSPAAAAPHRPEGAQWKADGTGPTYRGSMVHTAPARAGIRNYQKILRVPITGRYDKATERAVLRVQRQRRWLDDTGRIDYPTSLSIFVPVIEREARAAGIRPRLLCAHLWAESRLDPRAVGRKGIDFGIAQIVPRWRPGTDPWDAQHSIRRMARDDAAAIRQFGEYAGPIAWWKPEQAKTAARGKPSKAAAAYRERIHKAPCGGLR